MLEDWQYEKLKALANRSGRSISDLVREILSGHFESGARAADRLSEVEGVAEGPEDLGREHDRYLYGRSAGE
jgi:hypothetical protein